MKWCNRKLASVWESLITSDFPWDNTKQYKVINFYHYFSSYFVCKQCKSLSLWWQIYYYPIISEQVIILCATAELQYKAIGKQAIYGTWWTEWINDCTQCADISISSLTNDQDKVYDQQMGIISAVFNEMRQIIMIQRCIMFKWSR